MSQDQSFEAIRHPFCPDCAAHGLAKSVTIKASQRTVGYECSACHHKWDLITEVLSATWASLDGVSKT